ncbi:FKBP_C domain-containing protein [Cephalotus follicularis]|uniref:peptidylprolyl isomerase n=1 Tax=Cephalotus follicularis TaxID=3775 RepID=A0A1Q3CJ41_CEPFO|nr:FKBP_C domain-containing protein [Cephalotus follicularis]
MSSLAFSVGTCTPRKLIIPSTSIANLDRTEASAIKLLSHNQECCSPQQLQIYDSPTLFRRREAIGFVFCFGVFDVLLQLQPASAAETAPCELNVAPSGLAFCDKLVGTGPEAVKGQLIKAHYVGKLENGKVFDSSYNRGKPLTFRVGVGEVIQGWDRGILGGDGVPPMLAGGERTLKLPPELGYGSRGAGCRGGSCIIPPDSVLIFDVEFIGEA